MNKTSSSNSSAALTAMSVPLEALSASSAPTSASIITSGAVAVELTRVTVRTNPNPLDERTFSHCTAAFSTRPSSPRRTRPCSQLNHALSLLLALTMAVRTMAEDSSFSGEWNGEWTASQNGATDYDDDVDHDENRVYTMWKDDDGIEPKMSTDEFILYASAAILATLTLLFCLCHPEIPVVMCLKCTACCCPSIKGNTVKPTTESGDDYVGGVQVEKRDDVV